MSNNYFYRNFHGNTFQNDFTSQNFVPPPPLPPPQLFALPAPAPALAVSTSDQDFVKEFEIKAFNVPSITKPKPISISQVRDKLRNLVFSLNELKQKEKELSEKANTCLDNDWNDAIEEVNHKKNVISNLVSNINASHLDTLKKLIAKRAAKRLRLKKLNKEKKRAKEDRIKELEERSRKIDENLQKIKDAINKVKQEEELKLQADIVLKEVQRKKNNAKKFISKLDALKKLRNARLNTAKGRGENISSTESEDFDVKIDKLKLLWKQKLVDYEKEEASLRATLAPGPTHARGDDAEARAAAGLQRWAQLLFGGEAARPQVDFHGDVAKFVAVRHQWDQYASADGSTLPIGWVTPSLPSQ